MSRGSAQPQNIIFWGAGATAALGLRTTKDQTQFIKRITGADAPGKPLRERVADALGQNGAEPWHDALFDLITILGDSDEVYGGIGLIDHEQLNAMRRNWRPVKDKEELRERIIDLRLTYDWPALKSVVRLCPGSATDQFKLNDLFNLLDMHIPPGFGVRAPARNRHSGSEKQTEVQFFDARRLIGAKNALRLGNKQIARVYAYDVLHGEEAFRIESNVLGQNLSMCGIIRGNSHAKANNGSRHDL
jgi:hypothetical protein